MAFMKRLSGVIQAKANKALDKVEDPRDTLDLSYEKQLEQLQQIKRSVADVATAKKRIELQAQQLQASAQKLQNQAKQALAQNREDLAREALGRRSSIASQLDGLKVEHEKLVSQQETLERTTQQLQTRVDAFRTQKETLKASYTAAQAQTKIGEAVSGISESMSDTGLAMQRAQDKIEQMQARAGAMDELLQSGTLNDLSGSNDPLQNELDKASRSTDVELELAQLKGQLAPAPAAGAIGAAGEVTDAEQVDEEPVDAEPVDAAAAPAGASKEAAGPDDLFTIGGGGS
jgi:phage shock protein A